MYFVFFSIFYPWKSRIQGIFSAYFSRSCGNSERKHCTPAHSNLPNVSSFLQAEFSIFLSKGVQNSLVMRHPLLMWWAFAQLGPSRTLSLKHTKARGRRLYLNSISLRKIHSMLPLFVRALLKWSIDVMRAGAEQCKMKVQRKAAQQMSILHTAPAAGGTWSTQ